ncbi:MAG: (2Fe-2S) ferredoxin domain-containing protein [Cyanobacteria bacterium P01_A01_bin.135]
MRNTASTPPYMFNLEGEFLGFLGSDLRRPKAVVVDVEQEPIAIGIPQALRARASLSLKPGDRLCCIGRSEINFQAGVVELEASQIFFPSSLSPLPTALPAAAKESSPPARSAALPSVPHREVSRGVGERHFKILICQKKGCQRQGGRAVAETLERLLKTRKLQDKVEVYYTGCQKRCTKAPNLTIMPGKHHYEGIRAEELEGLFEKHFPSDLG